MHEVSNLQNAIHEELYTVLEGFGFDRMFDDARVNTAQQTIKTYHHRGIEKLEAVSSLTFLPRRIERDGAGKSTY